MILVDNTIVCSVFVALILFGFFNIFWTMIAGWFIGGKDDFE